MRWILLVILSMSTLVLQPAPAKAGCLITAGKCVQPRSNLINNRPRMVSSTGIVFHRAPRPPAPFKVGDILPDHYLVMMNTRRYGLPPVGETWLYHRVDDYVFRVDRTTREILEDVTHLTNRAF